MDIGSLRDSVPATHEVTYFNTGWSGPSPQPVLDRMREVMDHEASHGPASAEGVILARQQNADASAAAASLLKADPDEVIFTHGTTEGINVVLHGTRWQPGDELVTCNLEHMAILTPASVIAERYGVKVVTVEVPPDATNQQMLKLFSEAITPQTRLVALSHIQFTCGLRLPITEISEVAHRNGALMLVDGAQTAGQINIDVRRIGADFYSISGQKWLLGPQGTGALFIAREHQGNLDPLFMTNVIADERAEQSETAGPPHPLQRFRLTSQSAALAAGFTKAVELIQGVGLEAIEIHSQSLGDYLREEVAKIPGCGVTGPASGNESCGLVAVTLEGWEPQQVVTELWDRWQITGRTVRVPPAVRFSMASYNDEEDANRVLEAYRVLSLETPPLED